MYGGADYLKNPRNNATQAIAQAGSTFKPFARAASAKDRHRLDSQWPGTHPTRPMDTPSSPREHLVRAVGVPAAGTENPSTPSMLSPRTESVSPPCATWPSGRHRRGRRPAGPPRQPHVRPGHRLTTHAGRGQRLRHLRRPRRARHTHNAPYGGHCRRPHPVHDTTTPEPTIDENTADLVNHALRRGDRWTGRPARPSGDPSPARPGPPTTTSQHGSPDTPLSGERGHLQQGRQGQQSSPVVGIGGMPQFYGSGGPARVWTAYMIGALEGTPVQQFTNPTTFPTGVGLRPPPPRPRPRRHHSRPTPPPPRPPPPRPRHPLHRRQQTPHLSRSPPNPAAHRTGRATGAKARTAISSGH